MLILTCISEIVELHIKLTFVNTKIVFSNLYLIKFNVDIMNLLELEFMDSDKMSNNFNS